MALHLHVSCVTFAEYVSASESSDRSSCRGGGHIGHGSLSPNCLTPGALLLVMSTFLA